jgi:copper chaperone NosL
MKTAVAILLTMWAGACAARASGPPEILIDRSVCSRCGMLISEPAYAAAVRWPDGREQVFDDIGCLLAALGSQDTTGVRHWFHDANDGDWILDTKPVFVTSPGLQTPMGGGIVAFRDQDAVDRAAARQSGQVVSDLSVLKNPVRGER